MPTAEPPTAVITDRPGNNEQPQTENNNNNNEIPASKPIIGIIYPPPEVRNIVDKTASFVARNGPEFEARIRQNEINNPKFNFLNSGDPYNAYYQHKVKEFREGKIAAPDVPMGTMSKPLSIPAKQQEVLKSIEPPIVLKEPPPEFEFIADPPSISAFDLDIVKLTAQFVARNGRQFLTNLMNREQRNYQFDFLRPQHSLFNYFTKLLEEYTKVLIPPKDLMNKLKDETHNPKVVFDQLKYRVEWTKLQEAQKRREEEEAERERVAYAQVDWHDFVIVETVDYQPHEHGNFPPPTTPEEVGTRVLAQERYDDVSQEVEMEVDSDQELSDGDEDIPGVTPITQDNTQVQDMDEASSSDDEGPRDSKGRPHPPMTPPPQPPSDNQPQPPPLPPLPDQVVIRKDYNPKVHKVTRVPIPDEYLISPITGEKIPANKVQEHMRIGLLDPRWVEQRDRTMHEKLQQEEVYAQGSAIESSLKQLAERRTDIFGFGDEETAIGKKIGEEERKRDEKVTWDGHTASMEAATRAARANITIEEQIHQIHKVKGLLPDEEKERIGPAKPSLGAQISKATIVAAPSLASQRSGNPTPPPPPPMNPGGGPRIGGAPPLPATPPQPLPPLPPMPPQSMMPPQGMMMVQRPPVGGPPMRPPPLMGMHQRPPMPPMPPTMPPGTPYQQMPRPPAAPPSVRPPPPAEEEPPSKKPKSEETLVPEADFLRKYKSPATFKVQIPSVGEKAEWKLNGQVLTLTLPLTDMISVMKAKIHEETGMPPGKQKLQYEGIFFKDSNTLAYYNVIPNSTVHLQVKERGGRKK